MHMIKKIELKKAKLILVSLLILSFLIPLISAISIGTFKRNESVELYQTCNNCTYCNITSIKYPNSSNMFTNLVMNQQGTYYYWVLGAGNTTELGTYTYCYECGNTVEKATGCIEFEVTPSGFSISESQGLSSLGILISIILIAGLFMFLGYKFSEADKTFPIGLFFLVISLLLTVYALHLGYIYTRDIIYPISAEEVQFKVYLGVMWGLIVIIFIAMLFLTLKVLKEFRERKSLIRYGEGWNPKTQQYDY